MRRPFLVLSLGLFIGLALLLVGLKDTPIDEYSANNADEQKINAVLVQLMDTRNALDVEGFLAVFHTDAQYMIGPDLMVSKPELKQMLPGLWLEGCGDCMTWECITEHCYQTAALSNPEYRIEPDRAEAQVTVQAGFYRGKLNINLIRQNRGWLITKLARPLN